MKQHLVLCVIPEESIKKKDRTGNFFPIKSQTDLPLTKTLLTPTFTLFSTGGERMEKLSTVQVM